MWSLTFMVDGNKRVERIPDAISRRPSRSSSPQTPSCSLCGGRSRRRSGDKAYSSCHLFAVAECEPGVMVFVGRRGTECSTTDGDGSRPRAVRRNEPCPCGSGNKYKKCCLLRRHSQGTSSSSEGGREALPGWVANSRRKLHQFVKYVCNVYRLPRLLGGLSDRRRTPKIPTFDVVNSLFHTALLRIPSLNALEGDLKESEFQKLIGSKPTQNVKVFSAEVVANVLDKLDLADARWALEDLFWRAERNKAFRELGTFLLIPPPLPTLPRAQGQDEAQVRRDRRGQAVLPSLCRCPSGRSPHRCRARHRTGAQPARSSGGRRARGQGR